jgi:hypothetical protein
VAAPARPLEEPEPEPSPKRTRIGRVVVKNSKYN